MRTAAALRFQQPGVTFDELEHRYTFEGQPVLNVTSVLREHKISADWSKVDPFVLVAKRELGRAAHIATQYFDEGDLHPLSVAPEVIPYLDAWRRCVEDLDVQILLIEAVLVHPWLRFGGMVDRFAIVHSLQDAGLSYPVPCVLDMKTGDPDDAGAGPQTAAYEQLIRAVLTPECFGLPLESWNAAWPRYSVQLLPTSNYKLTTYTSVRDWHRFQWAFSLEAGAHPSWRRR